MQNILSLDALEREATPETPAEKMNVSDSTPRAEDCKFSSLPRYVFSAWFSVYLLFLPVFLLVLYIGFNKWRRPQSAAGGLSHSDVFTLHMVLMETFCISGSCVQAYGFGASNRAAYAIGRMTITTTATGQVLFHSLTCVERYLAVVHPVSYLRLRREGGVTIRNICISVVWVFSLVYCALLEFIRNRTFHALMSFLLALAPLFLVAYCSFYVLFVLIRPKPGEGGGLRRQMDQSKRSIVYTMATILGVLLLRLITSAAYNTTLLMPQLGVDLCALGFLSVWATLPSSLVLPLLFLQRAGKLRVCK